MVQTELFKRSPLRIMEQSTHGGVGKGNIGIIAAPKGVGATACLVHIGTDRLFVDKHVLHISIGDSTAHIVRWYENIFGEIARRNNLDEAMSVHDHIVLNRIVVNFMQDGVHVAEIEKTVTTLIAKGSFNIDMIVIDGYDFSKSSPEEMQEFKKYAEQFGVEMWFSAKIEKSENEEGIPAEIAVAVPVSAVIIRLQEKADHVHLKLVKDHDAPCVDLHLKLDPTILLIAEE